MKKFLTITSSLLLIASLAGCAAITGEKDLSAPYAPVRTSTEFANDTADLEAQVAELEKSGLVFESKVRADGKRVARWKNESRLKPGGAERLKIRHVELTELERFVDMAKKYLVKYQLYSVDGKVQSLSEETRAEIQSKIDLAESEIESLRKP